jgi:ribonuclease P protein subunit POP4
MSISTNIIRGEFIGTDAKIASSSNPNCVGVSGKVIDETKNTFLLSSLGKKKMVDKEISIFHFSLSDGTVVEIDGKLLIGRPEDRLKKNIKRLW